MLACKLTFGFFRLALKLLAYLLVLGQWLGPCNRAALADPPADNDVRISRPAISLDLSHPLIDPEPNREPIAATGQTPGIYRAFLVWRQKYAHLAICSIDLCHGSCLAYGDGCLVCAQSPILPSLLAGLGSTAHACASGCAPSYVRQSFGHGSLSCDKGGCH